MKREDYDKAVSCAFSHLSLRQISSEYINSLEAQLKAKNEEIERLKAENKNSFQNIQLNGTASGKPVRVIWSQGYYYERKEQQ